MKRIVICLVVILLASSHAYGQLPPQGYIGLFADENHSGFCLFGIGIQTIYCFTLPPETGMKCVELRTELSSSNIVVFNTVYNTDVKQPVMGGVPGDLAACFGSCYYGWVQVFSATLFIMTSTEEAVTLAPFTGSPYMKILNCEGVETEALPYTYVFINDPECGHYHPVPELYDVTIQDETHIVALFDYPVFSWTAEDAEKYHLFLNDNPADTIPVSSAEQINNNDVLLTLEEPLILGVTYTLVAEGMCSDYGCVTSAINFVFLPVAVMLQGFDVKGGPEGVELRWELAGVDGDISFEISRRMAMGGVYEELGYVEIERDGDAYTCVDAYAEPGESYVYRVDYELDGETAVLFETDAVQTPALPLELHQNVPNPFNPATEISYYLPAAADVLLEIYDVTGKRIATLERGRREKGLHVVTWQGTDDAGRGVQSGIYFYRLRAGKEIMSKKMVLLR